jgi:RHS repeat-associated protein
VGNRLSSLGFSPYAYNASNQLTSKAGVTYTYDANGNTLSKTEASGTTTYAWDFENRLISLTLPGTGGTVNFKYDPFGRRIQKSAGVAVTNYVYDGDNAIEELDATGAVSAQYTQGLGIDEPLAMYRGGGSFFYQADGLGSIAALTDTTGSPAATYVYDSFGNLTTQAGQLTSPFRYTAREFDSETGLYYYRARYYDPSTGRFFSEDPTGFQGGINYFRYVGNDPADETDPSGLWSPQAHDALIHHALAPCGVCEGLINRIQQASRDFDDRTGLDPKYSNYHAMRMPGQSADDAIRAINGHINAQLNSARRDWESDQSVAKLRFTWADLFRLDCIMRRRKS